ncbi:hypothetical protein [Streptomyces sp. 7N604]
MAKTWTTSARRYALDRFVPSLRTPRLVFGTAAVVLGLLVAGVVLLQRK